MMITTSGNLIPAADKKVCEQKHPKMKLLIFTEHKDTLDYLAGDGKDGRPRKRGCSSGCCSG
jgi:hypothetical protein